jgi:Glycosyl transferases group 1
MKIAAFFSDSPFASWGQSRGFAAVLRRMGHEVVDIAIPPTNKVTRSQVERINKPIDDCELILVSGPEHLRDWINQFYPQWSTLKAPKVGWYHESFVREDYSLNYENFRGMFDFHVFPDKDDAEKYQGEHLPLGVDTDMFSSLCPDTSDCDGEHGRDIESAFIGLMYPKRQRFYEELKPFLKGIPLRVNTGNVIVHGIDGMDVERTAKLMAETYRHIKVFVTFPAVCNVLVAKILESMASGCYLVAPKQPVELKNYAGYSTAKECAREIREALAANVYCEKIARQGCEEVHREHRMELRFERIFKMVEARRGATPASSSSSDAALAHI